MITITGRSPLRAAITISGDSDISGFVFNVNYDADFKVPNTSLQKKQDLQRYGKMVAFILTDDSGVLKERLRDRFARFGVPTINSVSGHLILQNFSDFENALFLVGWADKDRTLVVNQLETAHLELAPPAA